MKFYLIFSLVMIMNIYKPTTQFNFESVSLDDPGRLQGGAYYSKIKYNKESSLFIETPKCITKKGIVVTGKKTYCDLVYTANERDMINWIIEFEQTIKNLLFNKSGLWFHNELDLDDIEYFFNSSIRTYKENQQVMRTYISSSKHLNNTSVQIYDENESIKSLKDVLNKTIKAIICFKGVKFTSTSFQLDIDIKQILIIEQKQLFTKCMISNTHNTLEIVDNINSTNTTPNNICAPHTNIKIDNDNITDGNEDALTSEKDADTTHEEDALTSEKDADTTHEEDALTSEKDDDISVENEDDIIESITDASVNIAEKQHKHTPNHNKNVTSSLGNIDSEININTPKINNDDSDIHSLEEYDIQINNEKSISLKRPNEVFYDIYKESMRKAKIAKNAAIAAYLEAKHIKQTYLLDEINDYSDEDDLTELDNLSEISED